MTSSWAFNVARSIPVTLWNVLGVQGLRGVGDFVLEKNRMGHDGIFHTTVFDSWNGLVAGVGVIGGVFETSVQFWVALHAGVCVAPRMKVAIFGDCVDLLVIRRGLVYVIDAIGSLFKANTRAKSAIAVRLDVLGEIFVDTDFDSAAAVIVLLNILAEEGAVGFVLDSY